MENNQLQKLEKRGQLRLNVIQKCETGFKENRIHLTHTHSHSTKENGAAIYGLAAAALLLGRRIGH